MRGDSVDGMKSGGKGASAKIKTSGLFIALLLLSSSLFAMDTPTSAYLVARDKAVAAIRDGADGQPAKAADDHSTPASVNLQAMLRNIVGPIQIVGFPTEGTTYFNPLEEGIGSGKLDGLSVTSFDGKSAQWNRRLGGQEGKGLSFQTKHGCQANSDVQDRVYPGPGLGGRCAEGLSDITYQG